MEVRRVKKSKDFDKWSEDARRVDDKKCFVIYHGKGFKLRTLSVVGKIIIHAYKLFFYWTCLNTYLKSCMYTIEKQCIVFTEYTLY